MEVVYIPADGPENGDGVIQCRAKQKISQGTLRLYPHGGTFIHMADGTGRSNMEKSSGIKSCYIKAVEVSGKVRKDSRHWNERFLLYSAMSHKKVASQKLDYSLELIHSAPFRALMLAGRDTAEMVNMIPHMEEYTFQKPVPKTLPEVRTGSTMSLQLPVLTYKSELSKGDLLVLPFDGGIKQVCCETYPKIECD